MDENPQGPAVGPDSKVLAEDVPRIIAQIGFQEGTNDARAVTGLLNLVLERPPLPAAGDISLGLSPEAKRLVGTRIETHGRVLEVVQQDGDGDIITFHITAAPDREERVSA